jgi:hypothetical protein
LELQRRQPALHHAPTFLEGDSTPALHVLQTAHVRRSANNASQTGDCICDPDLADEVARKTVRG